MRHLNFKTAGSGVLLALLLFALAFFGTAQTITTYNRSAWAVDDNTVTSLTDLDGAILNRNEVFNNDDISYYGPKTGTVSSIHAFYNPAKQAIVITGTVASTGLPIISVGFHNDRTPDSTPSAFDAAWAAPVTAGNKFYIEEKMNDFIYHDHQTHRLELYLTQQDGEVAHVPYDFRFVNGVPALTPATPALTQFYVDDNSDIGDIYTPGATGDDATGDGSSTKPYRTIAKALSMASAGNTILVDAGTYTEQVEVTKGITIIGAGSATIIASPATLPLSYTLNGNPHKPIVYVHDAAGVTIKKLTVDGLGNGNANNRFEGIAYRNAGGTVDSCRIKTIRNNPIDGVQGGVAIYAYADNGTAQTLYVKHDTLVDFQKNATVFGGANLTANVDSNIITGAGSVAFIAQNGVQVSGGAGGTVTNNTISGFNYTPNTVTAIGILVIGPGVVQTSGNTLNDDQISIYYSGSGGSITNNIVNYSAANMGSTPYWYGIYLDKGTFTVTGNEVNGGGNGAGIEADAYAGETTTITATNNKVNNTDEGFVIYSVSSGIANSAIHSNSITGSITNAIHNYGGTTADATCNWYGTSDGTVIASKIEGPVTYEPFLTNGTDTDPAVGFQPTASCNGTVACSNDSTPPVITPRNITVYLNSMGQATIQPFDVIQSVTDNCTLDSSSIRISQSQFSCADVGDSSAPALSHLAYIASTNTGNQAYSGELGMEFRVNSSITINQLGAFDHQSNGIQGAFNGGVRVAIFNKATQTIVPGLDALVSGLADGLASNHRLKSIAPVQLLPGNYVVVAKGYNASELNGNSGLGSPVSPGDSASGAISFTGSGLYGTLGDASTFSFPLNADAGPAYRYLAGTFSFSTDSTPTTPVATRYQAYTASTSTGNQAYEGELGMDFSVTTSLGITVRRLGAFDHQANGIQGAVNGGVRVAIFNRDTRQIVAGLDTVITGLADTLSAGYRLKNIAPVYLPVGNYTIVAKGYNQAELNGNSGYGTPPAGTQDGGGALVYSGTGLYGTQPSGFNYPTNVDAGPATRYLAGTFTYSVGSGNSMTAVNNKMSTSQQQAAISRRLSAAAAADSHQAYSTTATQGNQAYEGELGMEFRVNNPSGIRISRLGAFDHQANGIQGTQNGGVRVAIFNKVTRTIIAGLDATVVGAADTFSAGHRLVNIPAVTLLPGDYVVVAKGYNAAELNGNSGLGGVSPGVVDSAGGAVSYVGSGLYGLSGAGFNYPSQADAGPASRYLAGTFQYSIINKAGSRTVTITASDSKGNTSTATAQVTVRDTLGACRGGSVSSAVIQQTAAGVESGQVMRLYPNPTRDRFTLQLSGMRGTKGEIEVLDLNGRVLEQRSVSFGGKASLQSQVFSLSGQPSGVYFVRVKSEEETKTLKVIITR